MGLTKTIAAGLPAVNPDLAKAAPERVHQKAVGVIIAVIWGVFAILLLVGGVLLAYGFARDSIARHEPVTFRLVAALLLSLAPGVLAGLYATIRLDPDAGGVFTQLASFFGAFWKTVRGGGTP